MPSGILTTMHWIHITLHSVTIVIIALLYWQTKELQKLNEESRESTISTSPENVYEEDILFMEHLKTRGSSVNCWGTNHQDRMCHFENLCYVPSLDNYIFFHGVGSIISGVPRNRFEPALLELSSVANHSSQYFNFIDIPSNKAEDVLTGVKVIRNKSLIFKRFNPMNLMHVIHDDLLPLYHTLDILSIGTNRNDNTTFDIQLVFADASTTGSYDDLYKLFSKHDPLVLSDISATTPVCFTDVYVGISKFTTWYQYGFFEPQGPIKSGVTSIEINKFTNFVQHKLDLVSHQTKSKSSESENALILSRKENRLILNENELAHTLSKELGLKVFIMSLESHSLKQILQVMQYTRLLIGMHGSLLILSMFLPPGAVLIEMFPFGVNPENYTPYKTLTQLPGMGITYKSWRNLDRAKSRAYPDRLPHEGGIRHLDEKDQKKIKEMVEVPTHLCCKDPAWLYHIYQDTVVDPESLVDISKGALSESKSKLLNHAENAEAIVQRSIFPSEVTSINCVQDQSGSLHINFEPPLNLLYIAPTLVQYEIWIQDQGMDEIKAWIISATPHVFQDGVNKNSDFVIWVRCLIDTNRAGPFNVRSVQCEKQTEH